MRFYSTLALLLIFASSSNAAIITADANGTDSTTVTDFWGVNFDSGTGSIQSITFDLSSISGNPEFTSTMPILDFTSFTGGLDVYAFGTSTQTNTRLTFTFIENKFTTGMGFRFQDTVNFTNQSTSKGGQMADLTFSVLMWDNTSSEGQFINNGETKSSVSVTTSANPVNEPMGLALFGLGLLGFVFARKQHNS